MSVRDRLSQRFGARRALELEVLVAVGVLLALVAASVFVSAFLIFSLDQEQARLQDRNVPYAVAVANAALNAKGIANNERGFLISGERRFLGYLDRRLVNVRTAFAAAASAADGEFQRAKIREAHAGFERWVWAVRTELKTFQSGDRRAAIRTAFGRNRVLRRNYESALAEAQAAATTAIQTQKRSIASASSRSIMILVAWLVTALAAGIGVAVWLTRRVLHPSTGATPPSTAGV